MDGRHSPFSVPDEDGLTAVELKSKLIEGLKTTGVVDDMKAKLRAQFIQELRVRGQLPVISHPIPIESRLLHSLVAEHLASTKLDASLSVFLPESGLGSEYLSRDDILRTWASQVQDDAIFDRWDDSKSLLRCVVEHLLKHRPSTTGFCQTDPLPEPSLTSRIEAIQAHQALELARSQVRSRELEMQSREVSQRTQIKQRELELRDREVELEAVRGALRVRENELRSKEQALSAKEQELRRAALLDARSLGLEEERLRAVERDLVARLQETDAALDALEQAQRDADISCANWQAENQKLTKEKVYLEEVIVRLRAGVESSDSDKERLEQRIKAMDEQFRHDKQQFEMYQTSVLWERENWEHERRQLMDDIARGQHAVATATALQHQVQELRAMLADTVVSFDRGYPVPPSVASALTSRVDVPPPPVPQLSSGGDPYQYFSRPERDLRAPSGLFSAPRFDPQHSPSSQAPSTVPDTILHRQHHYSEPQSHSHQPLMHHHAVSSGYQHHTAVPVSQAPAIVSPAAATVAPAPALPVPAPAPTFLMPNAAPVMSLPSTVQPAVTPAPAPAAPMIMPKPVPAVPAFMMAPVAHPPAPAQLVTQPPVSASAPAVVAPAPAPVVPTPAPVASFMMPGLSRPVVTPAPAPAPAPAPVVSKPKLPSPKTVSPASSHHTDDYGLETHDRSNSPEEDPSHEVASDGSTDWF